MNTPESDALIRRILAETQTIAVVGASPNASRPSHGVMRFLQQQGYTVRPVNPGHAGSLILGERVYASLADVPAPIDLVDVFRRSERAGGVVDDAIALAPALRIKALWLQLGVIDTDAAARARKAGLDIVMDRCPKIEFAKM